MPRDARDMLLVLLAALLPARADWVEIAQNTYRRPALGKIPVPAELPPEYDYPNTTVGGPAWYRGDPTPPPRRPPDRHPAAADKQEYYDIGGPDEADDRHFATHGQGRPDPPLKLNDLDDEGSNWHDTRTPFSGNDQIKNKHSLPARPVDEQSKYQKAQSVNRDQKHELPGEDRLDLNKIMQHFIESSKKSDGEHFSGNVTGSIQTKDVELDTNNTSSRPASFGASNRKTAEQAAPKVDVGNNKYFLVILQMFKTVANIISRNTHRSVNGKIKYLEDLKNKLLYNIQDRIESLWPGAGRAARGAEARGHVELPSSEGALMTISFLTFAVFLIKLVLQIIHTYRNKTMMMTPAVVTAVGRAAAAALAKN